MAHSFCYLICDIYLALPAVLLSLPHLGDPACPPNHPPITNSYYCVFPGYPALLAFALALMAGAVVLAVLDFRALVARASRAPN